MAAHAVKVPPPPLGEPPPPPLGEPPLPHLRLAGLKKRATGLRQRSPHQLHLHDLVPPRRKSHAPLARAPITRRLAANAQARQQAQATAQGQAQAHPQQGPLGAALTGALTGAAETAGEHAVERARQTAQLRRQQQQRQQPPRRPAAPAQRPTGPITPPTPATPPPSPGGRRVGHLMGPATNAPANPQPEPYRGFGASGPLDRPDEIRPSGQRRGRAPREAAPTTPPTPPTPQRAGPSRTQAMRARVDAWSADARAAWERWLRRSQAARRGQVTRASNAMDEARRQRMRDAAARTQAEAANPEITDEATRRAADAIRRDLEERARRRAQQQQPQQGEDS